MFWKIYFWAYALLSLLGAYGYLNNMLTIADVIGIFIALFIGMGVYSHAYNKHFFSNKVWAMGFYFVSIALGLEVIYRITDLDILSNFIVSKYIIGVADLAVTSILIIPALFAIWILANRNRPVKKSSKK